MSQKIAICQVADAGPVESLTVMLEHCGYECLLPNERLRAELRDCFGRRGLVLDVNNLVRGMGYEEPWGGRMGYAGPEDMASAALYVDVKAHQVHDLAVARWPNLRGRVLWYRIQGGRPEHVIRLNEDGSVKEDCGDERNPPCPVLTANLWYRDETITDGGQDFAGPRVQTVPAPWAGRSYACWPPFVRFDEYWPVRGRNVGGFEPPVCLVHGVNGWGMGALIAPLRREHGLRIYGQGAPDGVLTHGRVPELLSRALAMVHLKTQDAPGYALYEALAAACPLVVSRNLVWKNRMDDLLQPGETCLAFGKPGHQGMTPGDVEEALGEIRAALAQLRDPDENIRIGLAGRARLAEVTWRKDRDGDGLRAFMRRHFG